MNKGYKWNLHPVIGATDEEEVETEAIMVDVVVAAVPLAEVGGKCLTGIAFLTFKPESAPMDDHAPSCTTPLHNNCKTTFTCSITNSSPNKWLRNINWRRSHKWLRNNNILTLLLHNLNTSFTSPNPLCKPFLTSSNTSRHPQPLAFPTWLNSCLTVWLKSCPKSFLRSFLKGSLKPNPWQSKRPDM